MKARRGSRGVSVGMKSVPGAVATGLDFGDLDRHVSETRFLYQTPPVSLEDRVGTDSLP